MNESSKTNRVRGAAFLTTYLSGKVIDIGCGGDLVVPHAEPFDQAQGDANRVLDFLKPATYDAVHSSHCLEHMHNPPQALAGWWQLVKPGGYLIVVVPHEDLYEQGVWPSRFNGDHKATFRLNQTTTWSPCSYDIQTLCQALTDAKILSAEIQDQGYNHALKRLGDENPWNQFMRQNMRALLQQLSQKQLLTIALLDELNTFFGRMGATVDQTLGSGLAQIQVIVQKAPNA